MSVTKRYALYHALNIKTYDRDITQKNKQLIVDIIKKFGQEQKLELVKIINEYFSINNKERIFKDEYIYFDVNDLPNKLKWILFNYVKIFQLS